MYGLKTNQEGEGWVIAGTRAQDAQPLLPWVDVLEWLPAPPQRLKAIRVGASPRGVQALGGRTLRVRQVHTTPGGSRSGRGADAGTSTRIFDFCGVETKRGVLGLLEESAQVIGSGRGKTEKGLAS